MQKSWSSLWVSKAQILSSDELLVSFDIIEGWFREVGAIQGSVFSRLEVTVADGCAGLQLFSFLSGWSPHAWLLLLVSPPCAAWSIIYCNAVLHIMSLCCSPPMFFLFLHCRHSRIWRMVPGTRLLSSSTLVGGLLFALRLPWGFPSIWRLSWCQGACTSSLILSLTLQCTSREKEP